MKWLCSTRAQNWVSREHIAELCAKHEITRSQCQRSAQAWAAREFSEICISPIRSAISYATALHEIGHIVGPHQSRRDSMARERGAWRWAKANALVWTSAMERHADGALAYVAKKLSGGAS